MYQLTRLTWTAALGSQRAPGSAEASTTSKWGLKQFGPWKHVGGVALVIVVVCVVAVDDVAVVGETVEVALVVVAGLNHICVRSPMRSPDVS